MDEKLTLTEFKNKIREARAAAENKTITANDIPAPEGFVDTATTIEPAVESVTNEVKPVETVTPDAPVQEEIEPVVAEALAEVAQVIESPVAPITEPVVAKQEEKPSEPVAEVVQPAEIKPVEPKPINKVRYGRIDAEATRQVKKISSSTLTNIVRSLDQAVATGNTHDALKNEVTFIGGLLRDGVRASMWEEGGMCYSKGVSLIVANPDGSKPQAYVVYHDTNICNGRHALVPVSFGSMIVVCYSTPDADHTLVYRAVDITPLDKNRSKITAVLIAYIGGDDAPDFYDETTADESKMITADAPFIKAAYAQATTEFSNKPGYVNDYSPVHLDEDDYWDAIADNEYRATLQKFDNLTDAYTAVGKYLAAEANTEDTRREPLLITTIDIPEGHEDVVRVFISGVVYTKPVSGNRKAHGTSKGERGFYARVILKAGDTLFYADRDIDHGVSVEKALAILNTKRTANGVRLPMVNALRRMTGSAE